MKDYDAIALEIYRDEAISRMLYYDQQEDQCIELIAAILRKHDEAEAGGELLSDIIETSRMVQHDFNGRTGLFCHQSVDGIFETYSAPTDEKALGELYNWIETKHGDLPASKLSMQDRQEITSILAREAPKGKDQEWLDERGYIPCRDDDSLPKANEAPKDESKEGGR